MKEVALRPAQVDDVPAMVRLVHDLASYEKASDQCTLTEAQLKERLFGSSPAVFAHVVEDRTDGVVGVAIWFLNFSTWDGVHGIYLEDLYVDPAHRGKGYGKALLATLATLCVARGYTRLTWSVLDWNTPSIDFYEALGATRQAEWFTYRLESEPLHRLGVAGTM